MKNLSPVNTHNEWDTLQEVIVGGGFPEYIPQDDLTFKLFFHDNIYGERTRYFADRWAANKEIIEQHEEDIINFVTLLKQFNVNVLRPKVPKKLTKTQTLCWKSTNYPPLNVRDLTMVIGDEIIETPVSARWRQFENDYLKHIFLDYFKKGAKWISAPRPLVTDNSYDFSRVYKTEGAQEYYNNIKNKFALDLDCGVEIMFDAANCMRLGTKILFNAPTEHERLGAKWLQQHLGEKYKVWEVDITDHHIDSVFLPLKPGLALITLDIKDKLPKELQKWDFVYIPFELTPESTTTYIPLASEKIYCNVLSISQNTIICLPEYRDILAEKLRRYNIEVVPSQIRYSRMFGGGHHCLTLDTRRDSTLEEYFT
jgi:glycine amidinotransferase